MFTRLFSFFFALLVVGTFSSATETYFEVIDCEANSVFGTIVALNRTQIVVDVQGEFHTIPLENVVKIRNLASSLYVGVSSTTGFQNLVLPPTSAVRTARSASERSLDEIKARIQESNAQVVKKVFPDSVIALELKDGTRLTASSFIITNGQSNCRLLDQRNDLSLPLDIIASVRLSVRNLLDVTNPPADWLRLAVPNTEGDQIIVGTPDAFDVYSGILHSVSAETIAFEIDGEVLPVPRRRVFGLVLHGTHAPPAAAPPLATVTLSTGTRGMVTDIQLQENELKWTTISNLTVAVSLDMVSEIDFGNKGVVCLFDFERVQNEFSFPFATDIPLEQMQLLQTFYESRAKASREIVMDGIAYDRGITLLGRTEIEYHLPKPFTVLRGVIGIEDQFCPYASATLQILADSQVLGTWELRGDAVAQRVHLNLPQNCRLIRFIVAPLPQSGVPTVLTIADMNVWE